MSDIFRLGSPLPRGHPLTASWLSKDKATHSLGRPGASHPPQASPSSSVAMWQHCAAFFPSPETLTLQFRLPFSFKHFPSRDCKGSVFLFRTRTRTRNRAWGPLVTVVVVVLVARLAAHCHCNFCCRAQLFNLKHASGTEHSSAVKWGCPDLAWLLDCVNASCQDPGPGSEDPDEQ